jgi:hypothetical protein
MLLAIYDHSFKVQATVITIVKYDRKTFIAQATDLNFFVSRHLAEWILAVCRGMNKFNRLEFYFDECLKESSEHAQKSF